MNLTNNVNMAKIDFTNLKKSREDIRTRRKTDIQSLKPVLFGTLVAAIATGCIQAIFLTLYFNQSTGTIIYPSNFRSIVLTWSIVLLVLEVVAFKLYVKYIVGIPTEVCVSMKYEGTKKDNITSITKSLKRIVDFINPELKIVNTPQGQTLCLKDTDDQANYLLNLDFSSDGLVNMYYLPSDDVSMQILDLLLDKNIKT